MILIGPFYFWHRQITFPAVTVCNQNRVSCEKLDAVKVSCEQYNSQNGNVSIEIDETLRPEYTICNKTVGGTRSIIQYLFEEGKCSTICREGMIIIVLSEYVSKV